MTSVFSHDLKQQKRCPINHHGKNAISISRFATAAYTVRDLHFYNEWNLTFRRLARFSGIINNSAPRHIRRGLVSVNQTFEDLLFALPLYQHVDTCEIQAIEWIDWQKEQNSWSYSNLQTDIFDLSDEEIKRLSEDIAKQLSVDIHPDVDWEDLAPLKNNSWLPKKPLKDIYTDISSFLEVALPNPTSDGRLIRLIEALVEFLIQLSLIQSVGKKIYRSLLFSICRQFLRAALGRSLTDILNSMVSVILEFVDNSGVLQSDEDDVPFFNPFSVIQRLFVSWDTYQDHPLVLRLRSVLHKAIALALLPSWGIKFHSFLYTKAETEALKRVSTSNVGFIGTLIETVTWIGERLVNVYHTGSWNTFLLNGKDMAKWADSCYEVRELSQQLYDPESCGFDYNSYVGKVNQCVEQGENYLSYASNLKPNEKMTIKRLLSEMRLLRGSILSSAEASKMRAAPFPTLLYGGSCLGKSSIIAILESYFSKLFNVPNGPEYKYTRTFQEKHWNNFKSSVIFVTLDDISAKNPNLEPDLSMAEVLQIFNNISLMPEQAALEGKGKTPFRAQFVTGTTNIKHLNAHIYYCSTLAVRRRFPLITTVTVKPEYSRLDGGQLPLPYDRMLDSSLVPPAQPGEPQDLWNFKVERIIAAPTQENVPQGANTQVIAEDMNIYEWLRMMGQEAAKHRQNQENMLSVQRGYDAMDVCPHCFNVVSKCPCPRCFDCCDQDVVCKSCGNGVLQSYDVPIEAVVGFGLLSFMALWLGLMVFFVMNKLQIMADKLRTSIPGVVREVGQAVREETPRVVDSALGAIKDQTIGAAFQSIKNFGSASLDFSKKQAIKGLSRLEQIRIERADVVHTFFAIGERIRAMVVPKLLLTVVACLPLLGGLTQLWCSYWGTTTQGTDEPGVRITTQDEKPNPWFCDDYIPSAFETGSRSRSWKALSIEDVNKRILGNIDYVLASYVNFEGKLLGRKSRILALGGQLYVTTNHCIPDFGTVKLELISMSRSTQISRNVRVTMEQTDFLRFPERDLVFFQLRNLPPRVDLKDCIPSETFRSVSKGFFLSRNEDGSDRCVSLQNVQRTERHVHQLGRVINSWSYNISAKTENGDCGSVILAQTHFGPQIVALHQIEQSFLQNASGPMLTRELIDKVATIVGANLTVLQSNVPVLMDARDAEVVLQPLHYKSPFRYIQEGVATVYGSIPVARSSFKSEVVDTAIRQAVEKRGYKCEVGPPCMKGWEPWTHAITDIVQQQFVAEQTIIDNCVDAFTADILSHLPQSELDDICVLEDLAVVNGLPGVRFIDKMKRNTSMGFPYNKKKSFFLSPPKQMDIWQDCVDFDAKFYARVQVIIDRYRSGERHMPVFTGHLKDEPTKFSKIKAKKTRVFLGGPADWSFVVRKYLLGFVRVVQNNKYTFEAAPGTNATSPEWEVMYKYLTHFGEENMVAGDFSKFDKRMSAQWILAAYQIIENVWKKSPHWKNDYSNIIRGIATDTAFPLCNMNGDLVQFWGSNPSGHPLTVIINSLVNSLYKRYAWVKSGHILEEFKRYVHLMTYGDDDVMGISAEKKTFNHTVIQEELSKIGVVYTMADKEQETTPRINISEISFLKRYWRWEPELQQHVAQLEESSIAKSLTKCLRSKAICLEAQAIASMTSAIHEYFLYGRKVFEEKRQMFLDIIDECDLGAYYTNEFPTFDVLKLQYLISSPFDQTAD